MIKNIISYLNEMRRVCAYDHRQEDDREQHVRTEALAHFTTFLQINKKIEWNTNLEKTLLAYPQSIFCYFWINFYLPFLYFAIPELMFKKWNNEKKIPDE